MRLRLLGGPAEDYRCIVIESDASRLRHEAMDAHAQWLTDGTRPSKLEYGSALRRLARETRNQPMLDYAESLLAPLEDA